MALPNPQTTLTCREVALGRLEEVRAVAEPGIEERGDTVFELNHIDQHLIHVTEHQAQIVLERPNDGGGKGCLHLVGKRSCAKRTAVTAASMSPRTAPTKAAHATT